MASSNDDGWEDAPHIEGGWEDVSPKLTDAHFRPASTLSPSNIKIASSDASPQVAGLEDSDFHGPAAAFLGGQLQTLRMPGKALFGPMEERNRKLNQSMIDAGLPSQGFREDYSVMPGADYLDAAAAKHPYWNMAGGLADPTGALMGGEAAAEHGLSGAPSDALEHFQGPPPAAPPKPAMLRGLPKINEEALRAQLAREATSLPERVGEGGVPTIALASGEEIPATAASITDQVTGKPTWEGRESFNKAAISNRQAAESGQLPQAPYKYGELEGTGAAPGTVSGRGAQPLEVPTESSDAASLPGYRIQREGYLPTANDPTGWEEAANTNLEGPTNEAAANSNFEMPPEEHVRESIRLAAEKQAASDAQVLDILKKSPPPTPSPVPPSTIETILGDGINPPPPPPPGGPGGPGGPPLPPENPNIMERAKAAVARVNLWKNEPDPYKRNLLSRTLFAPGVLGHPDVAAIGRGLTTSRQVNQVWQDYFNAFGGLKPPKKTLFSRWAPEEWTKDIQAFAEHTMSPEDMLAKYGKEWTKRTQVFTEGRETIAQGHQQLQALNAPVNDEAFLDPEGHVTYVARNFMAYSDPKWKLRVPDAALELGAADIARANPGMTALEIANDIKARLHDGQDFHKMLKDASWGKAMDRLLKRGETPKGIRTMLGEIEGPAAMATTIAHQKSLIKQFETMRDIALNPEFSTTDATAAMEAQWWKVPSESKYGDLAGKWVRPDVKEILDHHAHAQAAAGLSSWMLSAWKKNVIVGKIPASITHQTVRELTHAINSGGVNLLRLDELVRDTFQAEKSIRAFFGTKLIGKSAQPFSKDAELLQLAIDNGAWEQSVNRLDLRDTHLELAKQMARSMKLARGTPFERVMDTMAGAATFLQKPGNKFYNVAGEAWQMTTNYWRLIAFSNRLRTYESQFLKTMEPNLARRAAARAAAQDIQDAFTSTGNLSRGVEKMRKGGSVVTNPFLADDIEELTRLPYRLAMRAKKDPLFGLKVAANYGILGAGLAGAVWKARTHYGISEQDIARGQEALANSGVGTFYPGAVIVGKDDRGNLDALDFTWFHNTIQLAQGNPKNLPANMAVNLPMTILRGGLFEGPARKTIEEFGGPQTTPPPYDPVAHRGFEQGMYLASRAGLVGPTAVASAWDYARSLGFGLHYGKNHIPLTPVQAASGLIGSGKIIPIGPKTERGDLKSINAQVRQLQTERKAEQHAHHAEGVANDKAAIKDLRQKRSDLQKAKAAAPNAYKPPAAQTNDGWEDVEK